MNTREMLTRRFPGHIWLRVFIGGRSIQPGHGWMYQGIVRRDAWRVGPLGFGLMRMPARSDRKPEECDR